MVETRMLRSDSLSEEWASAWQEIYREDPDATPFQSPAWLGSWWAHLAKGSRALWLGVQEGSDLVGLLPLAVRRGIWTVARTSGVGPSDYGIPISRPGYQARVSASFYRELLSNPPADLVDLHQIPEDHPLASCGAEMIPQAVCLKKRLPAKPDQVTEDLGKSLRYDCHAQERLGGQLRVQWFAGSDAPAGLEVFLGLHRKRWHQRGLPGAFWGSLVRFQRAYIQHPDHEAHLAVLWDHGHATGALYGLHHGNRFFFYQSGWDPKPRKYSPGTVLVYQAMRRAVELGSTEFDFLRGDEPYKRRWKPTSSVNNVRLLLKAQTPLAYAARGWARRLAMVEARLRTRFEGRGLR